MNRAFLLFLMLLTAALPAQAQDTGTLSVTCIHGEANVFVDHAMAGKTPLNVTLPAGPHHVRVAFDENYEPFEKDVEIAAGQTVTLNVELARTSPSLYKEAVTAYAAGDYAKAQTLLHAALQAPGKKAGEIPFYLGQIASRHHDYGAAEKQYLQFVTTYSSSASGQYHLGVARQMLGQDALAVTAYKNALTAMAPLAAAIIQASGQPTAERMAQLQAASATSEPAAIELAHLMELKGQLVQSREMFRHLVETLAAKHKVDLSAPHPKAAIALPLPDAMKPIPATPGAVVYVSSDAAKVAAAWARLASTLPADKRSGLVGGAKNGWVGLASRVFEVPDAEVSQNALKALSRALSTDVLLLAVTKDGKAWYFYYKNGTLQDRYCSNPGRMGEIDYKTMRSWSGRPDVIAKISRGVPLSKRGPGYVTITDWNAILYFYYPEMRVTKPGAYRSPSMFMKLVAQLIGVSSPPQGFSAFAAAPGWRRI